MAGRGGSSSDDQDTLATIVKDVHAKLRKELKAGERSAEDVWSDHLSDSATLSRYSQAMCHLATGPWANKQDECDRILWCVNRCDEYFQGGGLQGLLLKDMRRREHAMPTILPLLLLPGSEGGVADLVRCFNSQRWSLLDVGSCYNPFVQFPQFDVTAIDIAPANQTVYKCDFLNIQTKPCPNDGPVPKECDDKTLTVIESSSYDIVVFSLFLSYLPTPIQRLKCCINAHRVLKLHGLLLIITPDSSHQNRHASLMKSWKETIEGIGYHRWRYEKNTHLHCMVFRKTRVVWDGGGVSGDGGGVGGEGLVIPQDRERSEEAVMYTVRDDERMEDMNELPFAVLDSSVSIEEGTDVTICTPTQ